MPRYFFHHVDSVRDVDQDGSVLPDLDAARTEAVVSLGHELKDDPRFVWSHKKLSIEVADENGKVLAVVTVSAT